MKMNVTKQIGKNKVSFQVEGDNLFDVVMESQKLSFGNVEKCGICGSDDLELEAHIAQGFKYTSIKCKKCKASLTFGQKKEDPNTYYLRRKEDKTLDWKAFEGK